MAGACPERVRSVHIQKSRSTKAPAASIAPRTSCAPTECSRPASLDLHSTPKLLVLVTDELDELVAHHHLLIDPHGERLGIRLGIVNREIDFQFPECGTA